MSNRALTYGLILVAACFFGVGYFTRILTTAPCLEVTIDRSAWIADSLHLSTILQDKDRRIRELDSTLSNRAPEIIRIHQGIETLNAQPDSVSRAILDRVPQR